MLYASGLCICITFHILEWYTTLVSATKCSVPLLKSGNIKLSLSSSLQRPFIQIWILLETLRRKWNKITSFFKSVWQRENTISFRDFLIYYNNLDIGTLCWEKMHVFYQSMDIDYLKEAISTLGMARRFLFKDTKLTLASLGSLL